MTAINILYIHSHDTGRYIQPYGHAVPTPHLQRLAEQGLLFRRAFCTNPTCSPSRASLLTGLYPHANGMFGLAHRGFRLNDYQQHLIHTLHAAGYTSALAGMQHIANMSADPVRTIGYRIDLGGTATAHIHAAQFLESRPPQPFFLDVGFEETHRPYPAEPDGNPAYSLPPAPLPDTPATRLDMACFKASARLLDQKIGQVLQALERSGLVQNTLVICTTDHGIAFPGMKCNLTDHGTGVMLILRGPGGFEGGGAIDAMVSHIDLFPTICDLLGVAPPPWLQGVSLMPLVRGEVEAVREAVFMQINYHAAFEPMRSVRTARWKYIRRYDGRSRPVLPNCDDSPSKTAWLEQGWGEQPPAQEMLYDLVFDPNEAQNLASSERHGAILAEMRARLERWQQETADPLKPDGSGIPTPPGAVVNDPDDLSPQGKTRLIRSG
jgi:arylsulfatase A-like enzyme